ncbi:MAG TPA: phosphoenolpyruvate carboxykinase domain-containing protein, partial [Candidatus Omnitrophota bacterium]|nr:phosphoenolpyruvate carboxykinase domain-containing protein [Candidatus Omnitrophota bacterium]
YVPLPDSLDLTGLNIHKDALKKLLSIDKFDWIQEMESQKEFLAMFGDDLPREIRHEWAEQNKRVQA